MKNELVKPTFDMEVEVHIPNNMPKVEHNLDKLENYAEKLNEHYSKLIIQEKDIKDAEAEKAKLNKLIEQVKRLRIDNVKEYKKPIEDFELTAKRVENLLGQASDTIKTALDGFDKQRQEEKLNKVINPIMNTLISNAFVKGYLINPVQIEENPKWFNKTYKDEDIENDIQEQIDLIIKAEDELNQGIEVIKSNIAMANNPKLNEAMYIERFKYNRDLTSVLSDIAKDNNVSHETLEPVGDVWTTQDKMIISFSGNAEQIIKIRAYAKELGMEEI